MKLLYVTCSMSLQGQIESLLHQLNPLSFQVIPKVLSESQVGTPRRDDAVWPGYDVAFVIHADDDNARQIFTALQDLNRTAFNENERVGGTMLDVSARL